MKNPFDHPPTPSLVRKGVEIVSGGHPQTPAKGASPLWTPLFSTLLIGIDVKLGLYRVGQYTDARYLHLHHIS
ncbi:MAG TPA: hypothetical protein VFR55_03310, partial [Dehalococcoidia bacterium]|nr:hypothetical protein [Dehalococcoidia bacterium]